MTTDEEQHTKTHVDIVIVGGGPVGLLAANLAVKYGLSVRIVDIEFEPQHWGRGDWIHGRTLELLDHSGLATDLLATGARVETFSHHHQQVSSSVAYAPEHVVTKYKHLLCVGQHITESSLQHSLSEHDVQVERPWTVSQFQKDGRDSKYPLSVTLKNMLDASTCDIRAKYLLGCDGAHSDIRKQLDIAYEGESSKKNHGVLDALVHTSFHDRKSISFIKGPFGTHACMFPRENNLVRVMVQLSDEGDRNQIHLETVQHEARRALLPHRVEFTAVMWWTIYAVGQHVATHYTSSQEDPRIFLCGDACHSQSPTLGQGLNTGFGDVFNLVWKIAMVESGHAKASLLNTYEMERHPVAQQVIAMDKQIVQAVESKEQENLETLLRQYQLFISGFGISYRNNENNVMIQTGDRAPDFKVVHYATGSKVRLYDIWRKQVEETNMRWGFHLLVLAHDITQSMDAVIKGFKDFTVPLWMRVHIITTTVQKGVIEKQLSQQDDIDPAWIYMDKINQAQCHHGLIPEYNNNSNGNNDPVAIVVRPDLHIGWIGDFSKLSLGFIA
ncbi:hypothetical protein K492DRAFT_177357 [Lichtheimia hyalospora FSU 10163]|nr:hypothetical protein K492DRAFT_177357 [Lichtheimia hyalospora FSU 10163]